MIRRTLALAGAAALAVGFTGLAGPASADPGITQAGQVVINEVAAELNTTFNSADLVGGFVELENIGDAAIDVSEWRVTGCTTSGSFFVDIPSGTNPIPVNGKLLVGDLDYAALAGPTPVVRFPSGGVLEQAAGGARLQDSTLAEVDDVMWGPDDPGVECAITNAGVLPDDTDSINRHPTSGWPSGFNAPATPENSV